MSCYRPNALHFCRPKLGRLFLKETGINFCFSRVCLPTVDNINIPQKMLLYSTRTYGRMKPYYSVLDIIGTCYRGGGPFNTHASAG